MPKLIAWIIGPEIYCPACYEKKERERLSALVDMMEQGAPESEINKAVQDACSMIIPQYEQTEVDLPQHCHHCHAYIAGFKPTESAKDFVGRMILEWIEGEDSRQAVPVEWLGWIGLTIDCYDALRLLPFVAMDWHGGQDSPLYSVCSAGLGTDPKRIREALKELEECKDHFVDSDVHIEELLSILEDF